MSLREDLQTIAKIAERAADLYQSLGIIKTDKDYSFARVAIAGEILTVHREIVPLRLDDMLASDDSNFAHDIGGIHKYLDQGTRTRKANLTMCFLPRFAA